MRITATKGIRVDERRVALILDVAARLVKDGLEVGVEAGAGERAYFPGVAYATAGAESLTDPTTLWAGPTSCSEGRRASLAVTGG